MTSVRARVTAVALLATIAAFLVAAIALDISVRRSLLDEIDNTITNRAFDVADGIDVTNELSDASFPADGETFVGVIEFEDGLTLEIHNDLTPDPSEILDALEDSRRDIVIGEPVSASLLSLTEVDGADNLRLVAADVQTGDELVIVARSTDGIDRTLAELRVLSAIAVPVLSALLGLLVWWLTGRALRPVEAIRSDVEEISAGDLSRRVAEPSSDDEIGRLARTMNAMLARLDVAQVRQRRFSSDVAHELRTPLTAMSTQLDVDLTHPDMANWQTTAVRLRGETERMQRVVDDLLALSRNEQRGRTAQELVDLDDTIFAVLDTISTSEVAIDTSSVSAAVVRGSSDDLRRVVENLVINAIHHADARVAVSLAAKGDKATFRVEDDGPGVPIEHRSAIFERFFRIDDARSREIGGSGLGLALASEIVAAHGGFITIDDSPLGGARFCIELPIPHNQT